jgi:alkylated DNA repair dioxygenase AlkB
MEVFTNGESSLLSIPEFGEDLLCQLQDLPLREEPEIVVGGRVCYQRRDVGFYSDESSGYRYSGQVAESFSLKEHPFLVELLEKVNTKLGTSFNGILINRYKNGEKYISAHSDSKSGLDPKNLMVAGIAYGAVRKFRIRDKSSKKIVLDHLHQPRELIVMTGKFQEQFTHEIPVEKKVKDERISVTFRCHRL